MVRLFRPLIFVLFCLCGCADIALPRLLHPGTAQYQQSRAERFDPYPEPDVAPDMGGGRPLQYIQPAPETERMQNEATFVDRFHHPAPPGTYRPPRTPGNRQPLVYPVPVGEPFAPVVVP